MSGAGSMTWASQRKVMTSEQRMINSRVISDVGRACEGEIDEKDDLRSLMPDLVAVHNYVLAACCCNPKVSPLSPSVEPRRKFATLNGNPYRGVLTPFYVVSFSCLC